VNIVGQNRRKCRSDLSHNSFRRITEIRTYFVGEAVLLGHAGIAACEPDASKMKKPLVGLATSALEGTPDVPDIRKTSGFDPGAGRAKQLIQSLRA
jgi:hypothetical protein